MADEFDILERVSEVITAAGTDLPVYIDKAPAGEAGSHILIGRTQYEPLPYVNKTTVLIRIRIKDLESGAPDLATLKRVKRQVETVAANLKPADGNYWNSEIGLSDKDEETPAGFVSRVIRLTIITQN